MLIAAGLFEDTSDQGSEAKEGARQSMTVRRQRSPSLTPLELRIMQALWEVGPASVKVVRQTLRPNSVLAYTSVQTVLMISLL